MRYFYDTEFLEDGKTIELISIGIVAEDDREYYAVNSSAPWERIKSNTWLMQNVAPWLPSKQYVDVVELPLWQVNAEDPVVKPHFVIANEVRDFLLYDQNPELWAWYGSFDHVAYAWLFGPMNDLPKGLPMYTNDLKQECDRLGSPTLPKQDSVEHHALADAQWNREVFEFLQRLGKAHEAR